MRFLCLAIGGLFLLAALGALGVELSHLPEGQAYTPQALGQVWFEVDAASLNLLQAAVERHISPTLWDPVILTVLYWPAVLVFFLPGLLLLLLCLWRRRRRRVHIR